MVLTTILWIVAVCLTFYFFVGLHYFLMAYIQPARKFNRGWAKFLLSIVYGLLWPAMLYHRYIGCPRMIAEDERLRKLEEDKKLLSHTSNPEYCPIRKDVEDLLRDKTVKAPFPVWKGKGKNDKV